MYIQGHNMDTRYEYNGQRYVWDVGKARKNQKKHGVSFEESCEVFDDPFAVLTEASRNQEERLAVIGRTERDDLLFVVMLDVDPAGDEIRIISARQVTARERVFYEEAGFKL